jgi:uncharacterized membrane protein
MEKNIENLIMTHDVLIGLVNVTEVVVIAEQTDFLTAMHEWYMRI